MQFDPVLILHHTHRQFEQLQNDAHGLSPGQFGMAQRVLAQAVDQLVSRTGIKQAQVVGEESVVRGAIAGVLDSSYGRAVARLTCVLWGLEEHPSALLPLA